MPLLIPKCVKILSSDFLIFKYFLLLRMNPEPLELQPSDKLMFHTACGSHAAVINSGSVSLSQVIYSGSFLNCLVLNSGSVPHCLVINSSSFLNCLVVNSGSVSLCQVI